MISADSKSIIHHPPKDILYRLKARRIDKLGFPKGFPPSRAKRAGYLPFIDDREMGRWYNQFHGYTFIIEKVKRDAFRIHWYNGSSTIRTFPWLFKQLRFAKGMVRNMFWDSVTRK